MIDSWIIVVNSSLDINTSVNVNSSVAMNDSVNYVEMCNKCLKLEAELIKQHNMVENVIKNDLRKFKEKDRVDNAAQVEQPNPLNPLDSASYSAYKYVKLIQELLGYVRDTCLDIHKPSEKLVVVTLINKKKTVSSMFDARHELCFLEFVSDMNASSKSKSVKKAKKKEEWKLRKVFTKLDITGDLQEGNFTLVGSAVPSYLGFLLTYKGTSQSHVEGLGHNLFSIGQFCDSNLEVAFRKHTCFVRNLEDVDLLLGYLETNLYTLSIRDMMASSPIYLLSKASRTKSWLWHRQLSHLNFGAINHLAKNSLIRDDYSRFTWVKFLASKDEAHDFIIKFLKMIQVRLNTPVRNIRTDNGTEFVNQTLRSYYESVSISHETSVARSPQQMVSLKGEILLHDRKPDLSYLHFFGALCYLNNDMEDLGKLQAKADIGILIGYAPRKKAYYIYNRRPGLQFLILATSSLGLVPNPIPQQHCTPPPRDDWDRLFQPMFEEYFNPPTIAASPVPVANAPRAVDLADSPVSTSIDQDAPSTQDQEHSLIISQGFEESPKTPHFHDDPLHESLHEDSTSQGSSSNVRPIHTLFESLSRWTKDHPIANVIGDPSRYVSIRKQLHTDAMWCYFDAFLTSVEPKNFKQAMTKPSWIDAMQEEIHSLEIGAVSR
ncbi:integrase, catalytic region, zinc finger, CCHC-type containing protein [Tanacetum coccineum]